MNKKFTALLTAAAALASAVSFTSLQFASANDNPIKIMENLDRGTVAVKTSGGVYLSWRLLGTEDLANQAFDIYRDGNKIHTTGVHDATCYTDAQGSNSSRYIVVPQGESIIGETAVTPWTTNSEYNGNSVAYKDIKFTAPSGGTTPDGGTYTYSANDMSAGDLDGDGEYEIIVKWDPSNAQDNSKTGYTGEVYIDAYKLDGTRLWRMDLGKNIRAGAHYTQFLVYDFDSDGKSEIVFKTAPGSKDGKGNYVSQAIKSDDIKNADDTADYRNGSGLVLTGPEWLTIFNGETGAAMDTVNYDPPRDIHDLTIEKVEKGGWGDDYGNRCERYLAGVAYLDGVHPSIIMTRGYYTYAYAAAYSWDGANLTEQWLSSNDQTGCTVTYADGTEKRQNGKTLYGQGAHSVSVADVDNDGYDEVIFGSAILDHDGTVLLYDGRGHGDAEHVSDFDNDGQQEIFMVHEAGKGSDATIPFAVDIKRYDRDVMLQPAVGDIGRGVMANIDDAYAASSGNLAAFWSSANGTSLFNQKGEAIGSAPDSNGNKFQNFLIYWDGDLGRELLDKNFLAKQSITHNSTTRFNYDRNTTYLPGISSNNGSKATPGLTADILGDWREEAIFPLSDGTGMRIFFSTIPTEYRLTTLMHDGQYRCAVAWQNVAYNQPPHQSFYIGSAALAKDSGGNTLNYLAPTTEFDEITCPENPDKTPKPTLPPQPVSQALYERGTSAYPLSANDAKQEEWSQAGNAQLQFDSDNNRLLYNLNPSASCSASKTFTVSENANELIYDIDWYFGSSPYSEDNYEYVQFGDNFRFGWNKNYNVYVSVDGGNNYSPSIFKGGNSLYTKNIKVVIDLETNTAKSVTFDGKELNDYADTLVTNPNQISFGFQRPSKTGTWNISCGFGRLVVTENIPALTATPSSTPALATLPPSASPTICSPRPENTPEVSAQPIETSAPSPSPTAAPTLSPTASPTATPEVNPTASPTATPEVNPTASPTAAPTLSPSADPTATPVVSEKPIIDINKIAIHDYEAQTVLISAWKEWNGVSVIFAAYDENGRLTGICERANITLSKGDNMVSADERQLEFLENAHTVKVFVWKSLDNPIPLAKAENF